MGEYSPGFRHYLGEHVGVVEAKFRDQDDNKKQREEERRLHVLELPPGNVDAVYQQTKRKATFLYRAC